MFTGIVQAQGKILKVTSTEEGLKLEIKVPESFNKDLKKGASVSVNGVCLSAIKHSEEKITFDVIKETLNSSNLSSLNKMSEVNMERSLKLGDEVGGHILSGHVCCECEASLKKKGGEMEIVVKKPEGWGEFIFPKGYVALNGVSLTVGKVTEDEFSIFLIPETIESTNLLSVEEGARLNLEVDLNVVSLHEIEKKVLKRMGVQK